MSDTENLTPELDEEDSIIVLTDEDGNDVSFELIDIIEYEDDNYAIMLPADEADESEAGVVILKITSSDEEEADILEPAEEAIADAVFEIFKKDYADEFNFTE